jgi:calcineurin-like phosphoesterase family protein
MQGLINGANATNGIVHSLEQNNFIWHLGDISCMLSRFVTDSYHCLFFSLNDSLILVFHYRSDADDTLESYYESTWNEYMNRLEPIAANKAYMTMPGNHETTCSEVCACR